MNKQQMVDRLVSYSLQTLSEAPAREGLQLHRRGFPNFASMSERRLMRELEFRGLIEVDADAALDEDIFVDEVSGIELMGLLSRSTSARLDNHFFD